MRDLTDRPSVDLSICQSVYFWAIFELFLNYLWSIFDNWGHWWLLFSLANILLSKPSQLSVCIMKWLIVYKLNTRWRWWMLFCLANIILSKAFQLSVCIMKWLIVYQIEHYMALMVVVLSFKYLLSKPSQMSVCISAIEL